MRKNLHGIWPLDRRSIGWQFAGLILLVSSLVTLVLTAITLVFDYRHDVKDIEDRLDQIQISNLESIGRSVWDLNLEEMQLQIQGILRLPDVKYVEIRSSDNESLARAGEVQGDRTLDRAYALHYSPYGAPRSLGSIHVVASLDSAVQHLKQQILVTFVSQGVKTLLITSFILALFYGLMGRHLSVIANYLSTMQGEPGEKALRLDRRKGHPYFDELDRVEHSLNQMQARLGRYIADSRAAQARLASILDNMVDGVIVIDGKGVIQSINTAAERIFGYHAQEVLGLNIRMLMPQQDAQAHDGYMAKYEATKIPKAIGKNREIWGLRKGGEIFPIELSVSQIQQSEELTFVGTLRDISERKRIESSLQASNAQLQLLETCVSRLNDIVLITEAEPQDQPGPRIVFVNDAFVRRTGYSREEVIGRTPRMLQGEKTQRSELDRIGAALKLWRPVRAELINYTKSGAEFWIELDIVPVADAQGCYTHWVAVERDITGRKQAQNALQASETRLKVATGSGRLAIWEIDIASKRLTWDDNAFTLYRIRKEDFTGKFEEWTRTIHPQDLDAVLQTYQQAIAGIRGYHLTFRIVWPDRSVHFIEAHGEVIHGDDGVAKGMIGVNWDITEQKNSEEALRTLLIEKTALLKEIHHRVKNNLQVIASLLRLEAGRSAVAHTRGVLGDMQARIQTMALLHESLYRSGTLASIDLGVYLGQLSTQAYRAQLTNSGAVHLELHLGSVQVGMDQALPCGLLINELISNCMKHGFPDGAAGHISIDLQPLDKDKHWRLRVSDDGVGLPADFEEKRKSSLGLQLVVDLARQIGGELLILPNQNAGAAVSVDFQALAPAQLAIQNE